MAAYGAEVSTRWLGQRQDAAVDGIQAQTLAELARHLARGERVALVDLPSHQNVGDTMIYAGERAYLERLGVEVGYVCDVARYDAAELRRRVPEGPILLHGGGNFGDRWPEMQELREQVIADHPERRIIQLPQSLEFQDPARIEGVRRVFGGHPDLTLLIRESRSFDDTTRLFGDVARVRYCPDAAFGIGTQQPLEPPAGQREVLLLLRGDSERVPTTFHLSARSHHRLDWGLTGVSAAAWQAVRLPQRLHRSAAQSGRRLLYPVVEAGYGGQARLNLRAGRRMLALGRVLITDRLHAAVLGGLLGMPVVAMDNVYGKVSAVHVDYLHRLSNVAFAENEDQALGFLYDLLP